MKTEKKISLYCTEGGADKVYTMWLQEEKSGWTVQAQWGRRGGSVQCGAKTPKPIPLADAQKVYDKVMKEKTGKGYHDGEDAPAFSQTVGAVDSGLRPMLLTPDGEENVDKYIASDDWIAQQKLNGRRLMVKSTGKDAVGVNRRGLECPLPEDVRHAFTGIVGVFDGELIGTEYHIFDYLEGYPGDFRSHPIQARETEGRALLPNNKSVIPVPTIHGRTAKRDLYEYLKKGRKEGIVFKRLDAPYEPGRRDDLRKASAVKIKFWAEADLIVMAWNGDKQSVSVAAMDGDKKVCVGNVTIPTKYKEQVLHGEILRVRYLYATANDILYQPKVDPTEDDRIVRDDGFDRKKDATKLSALKHEGKEDEDD